MAKIQKRNKRREAKFWTKKMASYLHRTAQLSTLAVFLPWGIQKELVV